MNCDTSSIASLLERTPGKDGFEVSYSQNLFELITSTFDFNYKFTFSHILNTYFSDFGIIELIESYGLFDLDVTLEYVQDP